MTTHRQPGAGYGFPPGPRLPAALQTALSVARPLEFAAACRRRYGELFTINVIPVGRVVCVADAAGIQRVVTSDPAVFQAGAANSLLDFVVGRSSLLLLDGPEHLWRRHVLLPPFRRENIVRHSAMAADVAAAAVASWRSGPVRLLPLVQQITLEIMMRAVFGIEDLDRLAGLRRTIPRLLHMNPALLLVRPLRVDLGPWSPGGRFWRLRNEVDQLLHAEIRRRRSEADSDSRADVLSSLVAASGEGDEPMSDQELRDHLVTLLAVGHETTATTIAWLMERLTRHPDVERMLRRRIAEGDTDYLDAVIRETLRSRPVVSDVARVLGEPVCFGEHLVPAGTMVALSLSLLHSDPAQYPEPEQFRPERFLTGAPPADLFLPFGGGPHRCLGASFAQAVIRIIVPALLAGGRFSAIGAEERPRLRGPVLTPSRSVPVNFTRVPAE